MTNVLLVGIGGFLGAIARYGLSGWVHTHYRGSFPLGTLLVNVAGCLAIGVFLHFVEDRAALTPRARLFLAVGLLGGFTTFSSFGYETIELLKDRQLLPAFASVAGNVLLGLGAVWFGRTVARLVFM